MRNWTRPLVWVVFLSFLPLFLIGAGCYTASRDPLPPPVTGPQSTPEAEVSYGGLGVAHGIQSEPGGRFWRTYQISENSSFKGYLSLLNQQPEENYLLTCLVDYRQVPCVFDGHQQLLYEMNMEDFEERLIAFETPRLETGLHDLMLLAFAKPDVHDVSQQYRLSTDLNYLTAPRAVVLVGDEAWKTPKMTITVTGTQPLDYPLTGIVVNREEQPLEMRAWLTETVQTGELVDFVIHMGNKGPSHTAAVVAFLDYEQVPLDGANQWVSYVSLPTNTYATLSGQFEAPQEPGVHEFVIVWAHNPFSMLEEPPLGPERNLTQFSTIVEPSIRVAIRVVE